MDLLLSALHEAPEYQALCAIAQSGGCAALSGLSQMTRSHVTAALYRDLARPTLVVCQDEETARRAQEELHSFLDEEPPILPSRDLTFFEAGAVSRGWEQKRLRQLYALATGQTRLQIASLSALTLRTIPRDILLSAAVALKLGERCDVDRLTGQLAALGYTRSTLVEGPGQFALRGGILDVFSPSAGDPVRVEFFGDEVDAMGYFDPVTQRRTDNTDAVILLPVAESLPGLHAGGPEGLAADLRALLAKQTRRKTPLPALLKTLTADLERAENGLSFAAWDRYLALIYPKFACAADYLPADTLVLFADHGNLQKTARAQEEELRLSLHALLESGILDGSLCDFQRSFGEFCGSFAGNPLLYLDSFLSARFPDCRLPQELFSITSKQLPSYGGNLEAAVSDLLFYQKNSFRTLVLCGSHRRGEILQNLLREQHVDSLLAFPLTRLPQPGQILLSGGSLPGGMEYPALRLAILTEGQLTAASLKKKKPIRHKSTTNRQKLASFTDLTPGDLVVHEYHGIGRYVAMEQMKVDGVLKDYVKIAYLGTDLLYVPATQLDLISKYIGGGEDSPIKLNKLGGDTWQKTKARAKKAAQDLAAGLILLYAARTRLPGFAFSADSPWQQEFEESFEYPETEGQLRCVVEIKSDMENSIPMDRLLCGDVGFGKTEVALRAAMKAMLDGKQVAILVPTTVLAQQHYQTAVRRFRGFPVGIDVLSRFRTAAQQRATLQKLAAGSVDLIIGTHKLLQKDVRFKELGLLIVDEEQRFGVTHKERLKEISKGVDVLTLSATPIPRTLNMALSGIRDMSTIEEPPGDRYPVQTFVLEHAAPVLEDAMKRELARGGQVYYLHNRVENIDQTAAKIKRSIPEAEVAVAHGKMNEEQLSDVMQRMTEGEIQILVCTTIVETGIDIPNVNTLIIEDADRLGLSQLHQIRGRVGRSSRHAFAYLTYRQGKVLSEIAEKRLTAIRDFAAFGSGFKIAMRDLEIRGAGNLLGPEQSGHMMSVGYDMYLKLLEDAVLEERGDAPARRMECTADLSIPASIDKHFIASGEQRMDLYRRIAAIRAQEDADDLLDEILDRYGEPPQGVLNLIAVALLRAAAVDCGISEIAQKQNLLLFTLAAMDFSSVSALCADPALRGRLLFSAGDKPALSYRMDKSEDPLAAAQAFVSQYRAKLAAVPDASDRPSGRS
ncbi:MAG: transcription-repair coupling factor [Oscillospiraceae bacterium]|nr:transcription-repair coupling factor [Oscillospiraceae bacterium]